MSPHVDIAAFKINLAVGSINDDTLRHNDNNDLIHFSGFRFNVPSLEKMFLTSKSNLILLFLFKSPKVFVFISLI